MPKPHQSAPLDTAERPGVAFVTPSRRLEAAAQLAAVSPDLAVVGVMPSRAASGAVPSGSMDRSGGFPSVSRTKITAPLLRQETLTRERLIDWLRHHVGQRLTLVIAEAGYGKTTLLADFGRHSQVPVLWFKLDHTDRDWITLSNYLIAAFRELRPGFGTATMALLGQLATADPPRGRILDSLMAEIASLDEPAVLILDDFHLVDDSPDAREIVGRVLRHAPSDLSVVIATRRRPELDLGRARAQGDVAELGTDDLRFSRAETNELFSDTYQLPLEPDVLDQLERRTEGWAASLQLFRSSIRGRSALEIRSFVRSLTGTDGPIYDFLAQEVLRELTPILRRFVIGAAILERIVPNLIVAIFGDDAAPPSIQSARSWIEAADDLGLMGRRGASGRGYRFHPLLREFLLRQLADNVPDHVVRQRHLRVAVAAEADDWLTACHHYLEADEPTEAVRVLGDSLLVAIGTGAWGVAAELLDRFPSEPDAPAVQVILALREMKALQLSHAKRRLQGIDLGETPPAMRSLVRLALMRLAWQAGDLDAGRRVHREISADPASPILIRSLADTLTIIGLPGTTQTLRETAQQLSELARLSELQGLHYFSGVSLHNLMEVERARGRFGDAYAAGEQALSLYGVDGFGLTDAYGTHATLAYCAGELGHFAAMSEHLAAALAGADGQADTAFEVAYLSTLLGTNATAARLIEAYRPDVQAGRVAAHSASTFALANARLWIGTDPARVLEGGSAAALGPGNDVAAAGLRAMAALLCGNRKSASATAVAAITAAASEGNGWWGPRLRVIAAAAEADRGLFAAALADAAGAGHLALPELAELITQNLDLLETIPPELEDSVKELPQRWLPILRRQLSDGLNPASKRAAEVLDRCGTLEDVPRLHAFGRTYLRGPKRSALGRDLAKRASPVLRVHDLGRVALSLGDRSVPIGQMRRKSASLLVYLIARPRQAAPRERVLDDLWPDLSPDAAANSLNQTLYFLRRDVDPWYEVDTSVEYIRYEGEMLALDESLVTADSVDFHRHAIRLCETTTAALDTLLEAVNSYAGSFAPEFEYEDWSQDWRDQVAGAFLHLIDITQDRLLRAGHLSQAVGLIQRALTQDPRNPELHRTLVALYLRAGSRSAASDEYTRYATICREESGMDPEPLEELQPDRPIRSLRHSAY